MALRVAKGLRDAIDAECVILFGSRARGDWTERSDIDLMIIDPDLSELKRRMEKSSGLRRNSPAWLTRTMSALTSFT